MTHRVLRSTWTANRTMMSESASRKPRAEGTIASVFASLSGEKASPLPERFAKLKRTIVNSSAQQDRLRQSWIDLTQHLKSCNQDIATRGTSLVPEVEFDDIADGRVSSTVLAEIKKRGLLITRNVIPRAKAEAWLDSIKAYIAKNPDVKGFPANDKQVFEIYWSQAQIEARSHPNSLATQTFLLSLFSPPKPDATTALTSSSSSLQTPLTYCDRLRIRLPGDSQFALGPHVDGGSIERWEDEMYRKSYEAVLDGRWRDYDPWDMSSRTEANMNMYDGPGACGVFRAMQGWTSLSTTGPGQGTLRAYPLQKEGSAYMMLRPFFAPVLPKSLLSTEDFLEPTNWQLDLDSSDFPNSPLGRSQEFNDDTHPHLELSRTMVSLKEVRPGDQAWWHCDGIHSVEAAHTGTEPSAVVYIPAVPYTKANAAYIRDQKDSFLKGIPPPDFPGGQGESRFRGRGGLEDVVGEAGKRAMGLLQN